MVLIKLEEISNVYDIIYIYITLASNINLLSRGVFDYLSLGEGKKFCPCCFETVYLKQRNEAVNSTLTMKQPGYFNQFYRYSRPLLEERLPLFRPLIMQKSVSFYVRCAIVKSI